MSDDRVVNAMGSAFPSGPATGTARRFGAAPRFTEFTYT